MMLEGLSRLLVFGHIPTHNGTISVSRQESSSGLWENNYMMLTDAGNHLVGNHGADIAVCVVKGLCLVCFAVSRSNLAVGAAHDDRALRRPGEAGDR